MLKSLLLFGAARRLSSPFGRFFMSTFNLYFLHQFSHFKGEREGEWREGDSAAFAFRLYVLHLWLDPLIHASHCSLQTWIQDLSIFRKMYKRSCHRRERRRNNNKGPSVGSFLEQSHETESHATALRKAPPPLKNENGIEISFQRAWIIATACSFRLFRDSFVPFLNSYFFLFLTKKSLASKWNEQKGWQKKGNTINMHKHFGVRSGPGSSWSSGVKLQFEPSELLDHELLIACTRAWRSSNQHESIEFGLF